MGRTRTILAALLAATVGGEHTPVISADRAESATRGPTVEARPPTPEPQVPTCAALSGRLLSRAAAADAVTSRAEQEETVHIVREVGQQGSSCVASLVDSLARGPTCGSVAGFILSTVALEDAASSQQAFENALTSKVPCGTTVVAALGEIPDPAPTLVDAAEAWAMAQTEPMRRSGGLVVLGSLAHHARESGHPALAERVDTVLARELGLRLSSDKGRVQRLEAAGNAGCEPCLPLLRVALRDASPQIRRTAVGALRFIGGETAPRAMCRLLDEDPVVDVRDQAAWALGWGSDDARTRVECLVRAAARDPSARVRISAVRSAAAMAKESPLAREGLLQLAGPEYGDANVRDFAIGVVTAFPPDMAQTDVVSLR